MVTTNNKNMPRPAGRAIVVLNDQLLVMKRNKFGNEYVTLVGGRLEPGESPEEAVLREATEETGLKLRSPKLVFIEEASGSWGIQYIFLCEYVSGVPKLDPLSEEYESTLAGKNTYQPIWYSLNELNENRIPFRTERLRKEILSAIRTSFPLSVKRWTP